MAAIACSSAEEAAHGDSSVALLDGQFLLKGTGKVNLALFRDCLTWHRMAESRPVVHHYFGEISCTGGLCGPGSLPRVSAPCSVRDIYGIQMLPEAQPMKLKGRFRKPTQMYGFVVHSFWREATKWVPRQLEFLHKSREECTLWVRQLQALLEEDTERPKKLLVFVNPYGGHRKGVRRWEDCKEILDRAGIDLEVVVTTHRNHAYERMEAATEEELEGFDGIVVVGGDGFFNEVLNGLAKSRHLAPPCRRPQPRAVYLATETLGITLSAPAGTQGTPLKGTPGKHPGEMGPLRATSSVPGFELNAVADYGSGNSHLTNGAGANELRQRFTNGPGAAINLVGNGAAFGKGDAAGSGAAIGANAKGQVSGSGGSIWENVLVEGGGATAEAEAEEKGKDSGNTQHSTADASGAQVNAHGGAGEGAEAASPSAGPGAGADLLEALSVGLSLRKRIRIGIIPAGSTDCIAMSATGSRDHVTSALHIAVGNRMPLDVVRITSWEHGPKHVEIGKTPAETPTNGRTPNKTPDKTPYKTPDKTPSKTPNKTPNKTPLRTPSGTGAQTPVGASPFGLGGRGGMLNGGTPKANGVPTGELRDFASFQAGSGIPEDGCAIDGVTQAKGVKWVGQYEDSQLGSSVVEEADALLPEVRYAASFIGYGFYGDVAQNSERLRWMGPARYDYAGFMTYMRHRSYDAEVAYLHLPENERDDSLPAGPWPAGGSRSDIHHRKRKGSLRSPQGDEQHRIYAATGHAARPWPPRRRSVCVSGCNVCANGQDFSRIARESQDYDDTALTTPKVSAPGSPLHARIAGVSDKPSWRTLLGSFHSVGAAVVSCRNEKAPDGVAAHAHLADGNLHLILIRRCSRPEYLMQLLRLTWKGADPLDFNFVEHYKTPAFTFIAHGRRSLWNIDGELLDAKEVSGQVFRGLVDIFACGPEN